MLIVPVALQARESQAQTFTFDSPPRHKRNMLPKSKSEDYRLVVMKKGKGSEEAKERAISEDELRGAFGGTGDYGYQSE